MPFNRTLACITLALLASSLSLALAKGEKPVQPYQQKLFVITDQEGYGTGECLSKLGGCGKIIADSFCESKGFKAAEFYRSADADDITGSIASQRKPPPTEPQAFVIGCK